MRLIEWTHGEEDQDLPKLADVKVDGFEDVLAYAGERPEPLSKAADKNRFAMRFADAMAVYVANSLRAHFPETKPDPSGKGVESPARAVRGLKKLDVNYGTSQAGLGLGVSLKSVHVRDRKPTYRFHHNMKRNDEELRVEAAGYHQRQPYAVLVAVVVLPMEAAEDGDEKKPSSFGKWVKYLWPLADREDPHDAFDRFERVFIALYEEDPVSLGYFDVKRPPPRNGRPSGLLSQEQFVEQIRRTYQERNQLDFRWDDGSEDEDPDDD